MNIKNTINLKEISNNVSAFSKEKIATAKKITKEKTIPMIKNTTSNTKEVVSQSIKKVSNKIKTTITEEEIQEILNTLYIKSVNGIPKVSLPIDDLVEDYISKNDNVEKAAKSLINNSIVKCGTSGFVTGLGGITTLPANITSVMYVQLRMSCAIAKMAGYDIHSDQVQTLIYACLTGSAASDILKQSGIKFGNKFGIALVNKISGTTLIAINKKVGFRFITKFGEKGIINLGKVVPVIAGVIGGGIDIASTKIIGSNVYKIFINGELPNEKFDENSIYDAEFIDIDDIDSKTLKEALKDTELSNS